MNTLKKITIEVEKILKQESSGHDIYHAKRVLKVARDIQKVQGGDLEVIEIACIIHDMYRPWEKRTKKLHYSEEALEMMDEFLTNNNVEHNVKKQVIDIVRKHDIYDWSENTPKSIELQIVQDADNIDAIGAIGIARTFMYNGAHGGNMYVPGENLNFPDDYEQKVGVGSSVIAHFYEKLLKLSSKMNTKTGLEIAKERHKFMEKFLEQFFKEWKD